ncbi:MAG: YdcH family protein [Pseudomonadota bacterium]
MSTTEHVEALKAKHADLDKLIAEEEARPHPDDVRLTELKRQKLKIKDEIAILTRH